MRARCVISIGRRSDCGGCGAPAELDVTHGPAHSVARRKPPRRRPLTVIMMSDMSGPRFGFWAPVYGSWGIQHDPDNPPDSSYARNRQLLREAEELGFDST